MTYGEIKIETLKMMFANENEELTAETLSDYESDENYRGYLLNMCGAINRCFSVIEEKRVLPTRSKKLSYTDGNMGAAFIRFDLGALLDDYFDLDRVVRETVDGEYNGECEYRREGDVLVLPLRELVNVKNENGLQTCEERNDVAYFAIYRPKIKRITYATPSDEEISDLPEGIASYVPYFLKGELFREDEPNEASEARNWFEQAMSEMRSRAGSRSTSVNSIYSQTEW